MLTLCDQGGNKTEDIGAGVDHDQAVVHGVFDDRAHRAVKDKALHEAYAAALSNALEFRLQALECLGEIRCSLSDVVDQIQGLILVKDRIDRSTGKGIAAVGGAVIAGHQENSVRFLLSS